MYIASPYIYPNCSYYVTMTEYLYSYHILQRDTPPHHPGCIALVQTKGIYDNFLHSIGKMRRKLFSICSQAM